MTAVAVRWSSSKTRGVSKERLIGLSGSFVFHALLITIGGLTLVKQAEFRVEDVGTSGIEVNLVAAPEEAVKEMVQPPQIEHALPEEVVKEVIPPKPVEQKIVEPQKIITQTPGNDKVTMKSLGGAITEAKPDYLSNPAPAYPLRARQNKWEGVVMLKVQVSKSGEPLDVQLEESSGYDVLDQSALKTVKTWRFKPALLGKIPVESSVRVPVRFGLKK